MLLYHRLLPLLLLLFILLASSATAQQVRAVKLPELKALLARPADTTYVVNFWATWCKPCIEELPYFETVRAETNSQPVSFVLISLDFRSKLESRVQPFVQQKKLGSKLWLLDEPDANQFIDQIEPHWSGAIPFTLVYNNHRHHRLFFERSLSAEELLIAIREVSQAQ